MLAWTRKKAAERKARLEEKGRRAAEAAALERQQKERLFRYKKNVLDILDSGNLPGGIDFTVNGRELPFKFHKSENLLWLFSSVEYLEQRTRREMVGRSAGVSIRVVKGVSVRVGESRGIRVESDEVVSRGVGLLAVTTKHVYFSGDRSFRIPFGKIVSVERLSDGVGITRDRVSGHPEFFVVGPEDAEFACDLILSVPSVEISTNSEVVMVNEYHILSHDGSDSLDGDVE